MANNHAKDTPRRLLDELLEDLNNENERLAADLRKALAEIAALRQQRDHLLVALREARERRARVSHRPNAAAADYGVTQWL